MRSVGPEWYRQNRFDSYPAHHGWLAWISAFSGRRTRPGLGDELDRVVGAFNETLDRLEKAIGEMRQFSGALAHELRTPLAVLRGEIELGLRRAHGDRTTEQMFASQLEAIDRLKRLIDQILTLARAESGQIALAAAPVDVGDLASSLVEQLQPVADARAIELSCDRSEPVVVRGDAGWLERLLLNLLDNALKFTRGGGRVVVGISRSGREARITVRDTGIGMSAEDVQRAFEPFFRADPARSSSTEGAGLGLSVAEWMHGVTRARSRWTAAPALDRSLPSSCPQRRDLLNVSSGTLSCPTLSLLAVGVHRPDFYDAKSYGIAFRFHSDDRTFFRLDVAHSIEGTRVFLSITEPLRPGHGSIFIPYVP
jgi:signal transduction histidine kinase